MSFTSSSLSLVPRRLRSPAERAFRAIVRRVPVRVQRLAIVAVQPLIEKWPLLSQLIGATPAPAAPRKEPGPVVDTTEAPSAAVTAAHVAALRDPSAEVAVKAAEALRSHRTDEVRQALRDVLENRDGFFNTATRAAAARSLGAVLPRGVSRPLVDAVADLHAEVSLAAIAALVERDEPASQQALLGVLENRSDFYLPLTRGAAARGLLRLAPPDPVRVRKLLDREHDPDVRRALTSLLAARHTTNGSS
ncbi:MAG TPA: hypothetical protein VH142_11585 [Polyangiaceae bacterium]|jgi:HEAT repeat protein|nr:hypothetical protein [Polyangiaceae bacterium]